MPRPLSRASPVHRSFTAMTRPLRSITATPLASELRMAVLSISLPTSASSACWRAIALPKISAMRRSRAPRSRSHRIGVSVHT